MTRDFLIIGGGSGGIAAARRAAEYGAKVLLFEPKRLGGTCVNVGCVPKKVMWNAAQLAEAMQQAADYGFADAAPGKLDWRKLKAGRDAYVARLNAIYARNLAAAGVEVVSEAARLAGKDAVQAGGQIYRAPHILIASGGYPVVPQIPGAELGITSDGFFELEAQPMRPLIIGAGYIACELAGVLHGLGSEVTMLLRKDRLLRAFDFDLGDELMTQMRAAGVDIRVNLPCDEVFQDARGFGYRAGGETGGGFDRVLFAVARRANTAELGLDAAGLTADDDGFIAVDEWQNSAAAGVYALGDVTPALPLTPVAIAAGRRLADRLFGGDADAKLDYADIPTVVFSHPPIGTVGLSEAAARTKFGAENVRVFTSRFVNMKYALGAHKPASLMKLVTAGEDARVVGCHIIGDAADEMLQGFAVAVKMRARKADFDATVAIHPTAAEEMVTMR